MRFALLLSVSLSLATTSVSNRAEFSQGRDLPPLKLAAKELDAILNKTHSFIDAANGPAGQDSSRETVKVRVRGHEIEIPHFLSREQPCVSQRNLRVFLHVLPSRQTDLVRDH
jgi:hypothetical protein